MHQKIAFKTGVFFFVCRDELFETMVVADPHHRELSIHNGQYYNHSQPWISHISMQCHDASCVDLAK